MASVDHGGLDAEPCLDAQNPAHQPSGWLPGSLLKGYCPEQLECTPFPLHAKAIRRTADARAELEIEDYREDELAAAVARK